MQRCSQLGIRPAKCELQGLVAVLRRQYAAEVQHLQRTWDALPLSYRWPRTEGLPKLRYDCLYAVGGGTVGETGHFPQARVASGGGAGCKPALDWYFENVRTNCVSG